MSVGLAVTLAVFAWPIREPAGVDRLQLWAACSATAVAWLAFVIALLARHRFFSATDSDGAGLTEASPRARLLQAFVQNTLEQVVLAVLAYAAWLLATPQLPPGVAVACAGLFALGRALFLLGYSRGAAARALGFALTFYPSTGLLVLSLPNILMRLAADAGLV